MDKDIKQNILMVHNYYQIPGGEDTVVANEKKLLEDNGHKVILYTRHNSELNNFSAVKKLLLPFTMIFNLKTYFDIKRIIKQEKIDIVHVHNTLTLISPSVYYAAIACKIPVVQTIHNFRFLCPNGIFYRNGHICEDCKECNSFNNAMKHKCYRNSLSQTMAIVFMLKIHRFIGTYKKINYIFLTDFNRKKFNKLIDIDAQNVFIKPNFVNKPIIFNGQSISNKNIFVFAGRLEENKGVDFLLKAWKKVPENFELHIYGDGTLINEVILSSKENFNIKYFGFTPQNVILEDLIHSKALLFPSKWYETFGMSLAESLSLGIPVISSAIGNHGNIIEESNGGVLFESNNIDSFIEALNIIIINNSFYSENANRYYNTMLTKDNNYKRLSNIYNSIQTK